MKKSGSRRRAKTARSKAGGPIGRKAAAGKVRYAVVGLGHIAQVAVLPAFAHARNSELAALVSDDPVKLKKLGAKYGVQRRAAYEQYDEVLASGEVDAVYIALPNTMHAEYAQRALKAGVHVLCEKPMATTSAECQAMIRAADETRSKLMIAYRLHFEAGNLQAVELVRSGKLGDVRLFTSDFTMQVSDEDNIRLDAALGGGTLWDIGIYCINAARYLFRAEPVAVSAWTASNGERRFSEVEEMAAAVLRFPGERLASFTCSFGASDVSSYRVIGTRGHLRVEPAYEYAGDIVHHVTIKDRERTRRFAKRDQFAAELVHFSDCVLRDLEPLSSGTEGRNDVRIIEALYRSARTARPVALSLEQPAARPAADDEIRRPPVAKPGLVHVAAP
jgi:glucose-fructose oxidoreductase